MTNNSLYAAFAQFWLHVQQLVDSKAGTGGAGLPTVTTADNGKFLQVVNGAWAAATIPSAEGVTFGE